jgi:hypothetical protein
LSEFKRYFPEIAIILCALVRLGLYGFTHFPILDDWIQFGSYQLYPDKWQTIYVGLGLFTYRPLAGILDLYIWPFIPAFFIVTLMHVLSCIMLLSVARRSGLPLGFAFALAYIFLPINSEASLWLSASTRVLVPLFFMAISLKIIFARKLTTSKIVAFTLFQLMSLAFYEQIAVVSVILCFLVSLRAQNKATFIVTISNTVIFIVYYLTMPSLGAFASRAESTLPFWQEVATTCWYFWYAITTTGWQIFSNGLSRGIGVLSTHVPYLLLVIISACAYSISNLPFFKRKNPHFILKHQWQIKLILGLILVIAPLAPLFVVSGHNLALRNIYPCVIGFGLILDAIFYHIPFKSIICGVLMFMLLCVWCSETYDYRAISLADRAFIEGLAPEVLGEYVAYPRIANLVPTNAQFAEHILSCTSSGWAVTGAARAILGNRFIPNIHILW